MGSRHRNGDAALLGNVMLVNEAQSALEAPERLIHDAQFICPRWSSPPFVSAWSDTVAQASEENGGNLRIASWNACMKFREKVDVIAPLDADIVVVPESENLERLASADLSAWPHRHWLGDIPFKGLLVMSKLEYPLTVLENYDDSLRYILPLKIGGNADLTLLAVWTQRDARGHYTVDLMTAIDRYLDVESDAIVIGDLNSNSIWDNLHRRAVTHTQIVEKLESLGIRSAYHHVTGEAQGSETVPTHAFRRDASNTFHIDYCFASKRLLGPGTSVNIPPVSDWVGRSDHGPLVVTFDPVPG